MIKINIIRKDIVEVLIDIENGTSSDSAIEKKINNYENIKDRALMVEICHGVIRYKNLLDFYIEFLTNNKKIDFYIKSILRVGTYQLLFLDKIPNYAAINESVEISKKYKKQSSNFVNAVLRNVLKKKEEIEKAIESLKDRNIFDYLEVKLSFPKYLIKYFTQSYGLEEAIKILEFLNSRPKVSFKINTRKVHESDFIEKYFDSNIYNKSLLNNLIYFINQGNLKDSFLYKEGFIYFQDPAASLVVYDNIECFKCADDILDLCAAPGGKSFNTAEVSDGRIISCDINAKKLKIMKDNIDRLGFTNIQLIKNDATKLNENFINKFDICICDLPCSGFGVIRKKPEIKWKKKIEDIYNLHKLQISILENAKHYLKSKGILIYSTCTLGKIENEGTIDSFLSNNKNFKLIKSKTILPHLFNSDGFYISVLKRED
ncbi:16S rRNA (cytosine(967)-C(5))-methyltransferase RsmB [Caldicellulosiruptoraceae bacterium PP1]